MEGVKIIGEPYGSGEGKKGSSHCWEGGSVEPQIIQGGRCHGRGRDHMAEGNERSCADDGQAFRPIMRHPTHRRNLHVSSTTRGIVEEA